MSTSLFMDTKWDAIDACLEMIEARTNCDATERTVRAMANEIGETMRWIEDVASGDPHEQWWVDELEIIELLLGTACVVLQARITGIASATKRLCVHLDKAGLRRPKDSEKREFLLELGPRLNSVYPLTRARSLDVCANYFKHRDEWPYGWLANPITGKHKENRLRERNMAIAQLLGMEPGSTGNLRTAAKCMGVPDYDKLDPLLDIVKDWGLTIEKEARSWAQR